MATVYMATDNRLHRTVAIKAMHPHLAEDPEFRDRFEQEARNAARLAHPNLVSVLDQGEEAGVVYLVMEYLPGITLRELLKQQRFLTTAQTVEVSEAVLSGLTAAHNAGIIHRDLKPENVLMADDGRIKLADFGLARPANANTGTGQALLGTIAYLSPELVTRGTADKQSDVYAFGIMMFEMLTGTQPFTGDQPMQIAYQHAHDEVPSPSSLSSQSNPELDRIVLWATSKQPEERPQDASELLEAVQQLYEAQPNIQPTSVLATTALPEDLPATKRLGPVAPLSIPIDDEAQTYEPSASGTARTRERRQGRKGGVIFTLVLAGAVAAGFTGWWFGNGPGAQIPVPKLTNLETSVAESMLADLSLSATVTECHDLAIDPGYVVTTDPSAGTRVDRETVVTLCESIGPEILKTPELVGLDREAAAESITNARFTFGKVTAEQFSDEPEGTVLAAYDASGEPLGSEAPEQSPIDLLVSAGPLPEISQVSIEEAEALLGEIGLTAVEELGWTEYHDSVPADQVITVSYQSDTVRRGDTVGLVISLGPELVEVPEVSGLTIRQAMRELEALGFDARSPWYLLDEALDSLNASGTNPAAGESIPKGSRVDVKLF